MRDSGPLRTLIVDDEAIARVRLRTLCASMKEAVQVTGEATNGARALELIRTASIDLVLLDIAMPDLDGLAVAAVLAGMSTPPAVIFCTAHQGHALEAFAVAATDYLLKPVGRERLAEAIARATRFRFRDVALQPGTVAWLNQIWVPYRDTMVRVDVADVERLEAEGDYVRVVTARASYLIHETMGRLEERLDPALFVRVRRSLIVRAERLVAATHAGGGVWNATLDDGTIVRVGPTYWKALKSRLRQT